MILPPGISVIVVSRDRPGALRRCLAGLAQCDHPNFEVVVVADAAGLRGVAAAGMTDRVKLLRFDPANISKARNIGIAAAAGEIVAFIDDDAVPEPTWVTRIAVPFEDPRVAAATGFVRGRNGISFQYRAGWIDAAGRDRPLEVPETEISLHQASPGSAVKTEGTNMAFRRALLAAAGGFDPAFRYYMDETDLNMRMAAEEQITAVVPLAQVHHGFLASAVRRADRVPRDLRQIGASIEVFLRKHATHLDRAEVLAEVEADQRRRLLRHMVSGALEPRDVGQLLDSLRQGFEDGRLRPIAALRPIEGPTAPFLRLAAGPRPGRVVAGWTWQRRGLATAARAHVAAGAICTVFRFSPTALFHHVRFHPDGYWLQTGGIFGRSDRGQPLLRGFGMRSRVIAETARVSALRPVDSLLG